MSRTVTLLSALALLVGSGAAAEAAACRDAAGHFTACPAPKTVTATSTTTRCRSPAGQFIKCPSTAKTSVAASGPCRNAAGKFIACPTAKATATVATRRAPGG